LQLIPFIKRLNKEIRGVEEYNPVDQELIIDWIKINQKSTDEQKLVNEIK